MTKAVEVLDRYRDAGRRIAVAESCTGGLLAGALTDPPDASDVFERGFVTYSNAAKIDLLGVSPETLTVYGAVSHEVAREMAKGALARSAADTALSITGVAGPGASDHKPEGQVCFGLALAGGSVWSETRDFGAIGRAKVRAASVAHALTLLARVEF